MKKLGLILSLAVTMMIAMVGCGNKSQVDTGKLESSFKSAEPAAQTAVTSAITKIKSTDYAGALVDLQSVVAARGNDFGGGLRRCDMNGSKILKIDEQATRSPLFRCVCLRCRKYGKQR